MKGRVAAVLALCALAACGGSDGQDDDQSAPSAGGSTPEVEQPGAATVDGNPQGAVPVTPIPRPEQTMAAGNLSPVNNSGVNGSVNVRGIGEQTEISLNVRGVTDANRQMQGAIVQGTCEQSGAEVAQLGPIPVGAGNIGALVDTVPVAPGTVLNGQHALIIKGQNAGPATPPLACAVLPEYSRLPPSA
ncbi:hypothetical protein [Longimicrobium sp.]|uniref:hypothetical protein n=1 Tax=Longimicrobium sp. TaxID=2029185 RepID=UPI002E33C311|nr:hypothetical protein [Longimicrobium sp.]HEX6039801.1 hypothetical protein [Longimicrobium sp.]